MKPHEPFAEELIQLETNDATATLRPYLRALLASQDVLVLQSAARVLGTFDLAWMRFPFTFLNGAVRSAVITVE